MGPPPPGAVGALLRPTAGRECLADHPIGFVARLADGGGRTALVGREGATVTYAALADRVVDLRARLGEQRRLVLIEGAHDVDTIATHLAALAGGHVVALTSTPASWSSVLDRLDPDVVVTSGGDIGERRVGTRHDLHPDLALLLSTSGSTGSPKVVRLSQRNLDANADAIAAYLGLRDDDRAITTLPMGYCYGLSVLHSHLAVGASVSLTDASVATPEFARRCRRDGVTTLAGVPHTFVLLDRAGFDWSLPSLRTVTQAGGRLAPERVRDLARQGRSAGWRLFVMYGQTEATARMAYLPPELADQHPEAIGRAIPGGDLTLAPVDGVDTPGVGELVYRGPNVMLGYAERPEDLARGREVDELRTGDLARRTSDGLFEICGRTSRFVKLFGLRVDLDRLERSAAQHGLDVLCAATDDDRLVVATADPTATRAVADVVADVAGVPPSAAEVVVVDRLPTRPNGKPDHGAVAGLAGRSRPVAGETGGHPVDAVLTDVLGVDEIHDDDTFVSLGGDSLSYVEVSVRLEGLLGRLPDRWQELPLHELRSAAPAEPVARLDTTVVLRAVAIVGVVAAHAGLSGVGGGAHVLLAVAGLNAARFTLGADRPGRLGRGLRQAVRVALPTVGYLAAAALVVEGIAPGTVGLMSGYVGDGTWRYRFWFIEVLVQGLLVLVAVLAVPGVGRLERRWPFGLAVALLGMAVLVRQAELGAPGWDELKVHSVGWMVLAGWAAHRADTVWKRAALSVVVVLAVHGTFAETSRDVIVGAGILLLIWVSHLPVPRGLHRPVSVLAAASLVVYLAHWQVRELVGPDAGPWAATAAGLAAGVGLWAAGRHLARLGRRFGQGIGTGTARPSRSTGDWRSGASAGTSTGAPGPSGSPSRITAPAGAYWRM